MRVAVLQHIACEPPGIFEEVLVARGARIDRRELDEGDALPEPGSFDALVVMGGPMGAYDDEPFPWLVEEKRFIRSQVEAGVPFLGACLGSQLLAGAFGAAVYPGPHGAEVGVLDVTLTDAGRADPVLGPLGSSFATLQWHGDTFDLPAGAVHLARSPQYEHQAFRIGDLAYAVQFHVEVTADMADEWGRVPAYAAALDAVRGSGSLPGLLAEFTDAVPDLARTAESLVTRWIGLWA